MSPQWTTTTDDPEFFLQQQGDQKTSDSDTTTNPPPPPAPGEEGAEDEVERSGKNPRPGHPGDEEWSAPESGTVL
jgi:hypothetical protein